MTRPSPSGDPHALVVDDDVMILMDVSETLRGSGFTVLEAMNAAQALALLVEHHLEVELLFTDVHMPGEEDGFCLARRTASSWPHIAIVVASGQASPGEDDLPPGAAFMAKPFSPSSGLDLAGRLVPTERQPGPLRARTADR